MQVSEMIKLNIVANTKFRPVSGRFRLSLLLVPVLLSFLSPFSYADDLLQIYRLAQEQDPVLGEAQARFAADHTIVAQGRANLLPTVNLTGRTARNANAISTEWDYANGYNSHGYGLNLSQNLLNMQAWYGWKSAKASDQRALATLAQAEQSLILRVATAYFDVLRSQEALSAFEAEENATRTVLQQTQQRLDVGLAAITDLNEAQASADLARVFTLREERNLNQRKLSLQVLTGRSHNELDQLRVDFPIVNAEPASATDWVEMAAENSPAIQMAQSDYLAACLT